MLLFLLLRDRASDSQNLKEDEAELPNAAGAASIENGSRYVCGFTIQEGSRQTRFSGLQQSSSLRLFDIA
eukprot:UN07063